MNNQTTTSFCLNTELKTLQFKEESENSVFHIPLFPSVSDGTGDSKQQTTSLLVVVGSNFRFLAISSYLTLLGENSHF